SRHADVRAEGWQWLRAEPRAAEDVALWQRLLGSPYDDVRLALVGALEERVAGRPGLDADHGRPRGAVLRARWPTVLLHVHPGRRDNQPALAATERREEIDRARADRIRLRVLEHDSALRKLWSQLLKIRRLAPLPGWLSLNRFHLVEHERFLALARQAKRSRKLLTRSQLKLLDDRARHTNILRHGQKIELRPTEQTERISHPVQPTCRRHVRAPLQGGADKIDNLIMTRPRRVQPQVELASEGFELFAGK